jgi:hypothetical protein
MLFFKCQYPFIDIYFILLICIIVYKLSKRGKYIENKKLKMLAFLTYIEYNNLTLNKQLMRLKIMTTETTKTTSSKYSEKDVEILMNCYNPDAEESERVQQVQALAEKLGKPVRSVTMKLVSLKRYVKAKPVSKVTGGDAAKKEDLADKLADMLGENSDGHTLNPETMAKTNKTDIVFLIEAISALQKRINEESAPVDEENVDEENVDEENVDEEKSA